MSLVTLDQVEGQLARGFGLLRFSPELEKLFLRDYAAERTRLVAIWCVIGVLIYDLVYFGDHDMVPDVLTELIVVRFLIFTPFVIACIFIVRRWPNAVLYDALTVTAAVLSTTLPMIPAIKSDSQYLFVYQTYNSAAFLFFVVSLRPRFQSRVDGAGAHMRFAFHDDVSNRRFRSDFLLRHHHSLLDVVDLSRGKCLFPLRKPIGRIFSISCGRTSSIGNLSIARTMMS